MLDAERNLKVIIMLQQIQLEIVRNAPIEEDKNKFTYQTIIWW